MRIPLDEKMQHYAAPLKKLPQAGNKNAAWISLLGLIATSLGIIAFKKKRN